MGSLKKVVKKVAKPEVLLPAAALLIGGPMAAKAIAAKGGISGALLGQAATTGTNVLPALHGAGTAIGSGATSGLLGSAGAFAPLKGTLAKGIATGLANPFSKAGLATYGAGGLGLAALMGKEKTEGQKALGVDAQAQYDLARLMNQKMGGAYTDEELNTLVAPMLSQYGGEYETFTGPQRKRRPMFPGLNYSGLTRYAADGGSIMPIARDLPDPLSDNEPDMETLQGIKDYIDYLNDMDAAREAMAERVPNPTGRADGGLMQLAGSAGDPGTMEDADEHSFRLFNKPYKELTIDELDEFEEEMARLRSKFMADGGAVSGMTDMINQNIDEMQNNLNQQIQGGFTTQEAIVPTKTNTPNSGGGTINIPPGMIIGPARPATIIGGTQPGMEGPRTPNFRIDSMTGMDPNRNNPFRQLQSLMGYADGGSIPQTEDIPNGMQLDGRGGGFIPMGAKERKDDVPAMLAKNEFVMTADAVRAAGGGDVNKGAQKMYDLMNNLESKV
jgi:hypothetical protein